MAWAAQVAGTIVNLSGPLMVKKADGSVKVLGVKSEVEQGDTLVSEKNTYAQIRFIDNSEITLRPGTTFKIEAFAYETGKPEADSASFSLLQGGLRSLTGLLGKRNKEKFQLKTPTATIGIRGTTFVAQYVPPLTRSPVPQPVANSLSPGLHVFVIDGAIMLNNAGGSTNFSAGQFGFTPNMQTPALSVPSNPGLKFTPPPMFSIPTVLTTATGLAKPQTVDCEVR
ncbi:iron dicitrate transport regulator FecR [Massilia sp. CCM 8733]|uniref:Iron dicitrate transport regulator FecR n=2 Tax=Massilia mucilaginosa TaxID=2609282 RepID=A0ABX0NP89_9BURK|nr:FecR domain-containing protein [Massilia mucilaginosa]NHZ88600.1 iron dicitrate transport regulator FecR [Massilia mucilaginosa]